MSPSKILGVGIYGLNGHQIHGEIAKHKRAQLVACAGMKKDALNIDPAEKEELREYESLDAMLADPRVELVSLCSPMRSDQANDTIRCLEAGKHVYAEKPCALNESDMDRIIKTSQRTKKVFREMSVTIFTPHYEAMRRVVAAGTIGEVVQVFVQKSYPFHRRRPTDDNVDGGIITQAAVHATRMVEQIALRKIEWVDAIHTPAGSPSDHKLNMACAITAKLDNGGIASIIANYLNPKGMKIWGNEHLRIFGTKGFVESTDGGQRTRLVVGDVDHGALELAKDVENHLDLLIDSILDGTAMPISLEEELHPTRIVLRARDAALAHT